MNVVELRCNDPKCQCSKNGKLLVKLYNFPESTRSEDVIVEVPCPKKKSKVVGLKIK